MNFSKRLFLVLSLSLFFGSFSIFSSVTHAAVTVTPKLAAGGDSFSLALKSDGTVWAWGDNASGKLGDGTTAEKLTPNQVPSLNNVIDIAAGSNHSMALKSDGTVWAWGSNQYGQLGDGTKVNKKTPTQIPSLNSVISIAASGSNSYALKSDGTLWVWGTGSNKTGLGTATGNNTVPVRVHNVTNIVKFAVGYGHASATSQDGTIWMWGDGANGQIGDGAMEHRPEPVIIDFPNAAMVEPGSIATLGLKTDGTVWNWGACLASEIVECSSSSIKVPTQKAGIDNVSFVSSNGGRAAVIKNDGTLWAFGNNTSGYLGIGQQTNNSSYKTPHQVVTSDLVTPLTGVKSVEVGQSHSLAIKNDGTVWSWGRNAEGQLGTGDKTRAYYAVQVVGLTLFDQDQISLGDTVNVEIAQGSSKKYTFKAQNSGVVTFTTGFYQNMADTTLNLYDSNNNLLSTNDDYNNTTYSQISYNVVAGSTYIIEVMGYQNSALQCTLSIQ
ncbi:Regulator of chromosome condensation (RCC1) repeat protein [Paenibacillus konkukensis]|uniref:Regulator of chromosome condensation (RCC1) repeat protein n=1 Tax=Paenibacillus konkukensis TaxID=2020716 RepID=A0ABY4RWX3_9BACL|nr:RCC1 repeat- and reductase domain-containing protein [Paenibacillus konkukensis]UQZ85942.1 Regulator of chromosome condensation (RCC1) repeat protein [Paenibacillus konkukensis]